MLKRFAERLKKEYLRFTRVLIRKSAVYGLYMKSERGKMRLENQDLEKGTVV